MEPLSAAVAALLLVLARALLLAAEAGLAATSRDALKEAGARPAAVEAFEWLKSRADATFAATRAAGVTLLALAATLGAAAGASWLAPWSARHASLPLSGLLGALAGGLIAALVATVLDLVARAVAGASPAGICARTAVPVSWLVRISTPTLGLVAKMLDWTVRPFGGRASFGPPRPPLEDIERLLVEEASHQGNPQAPKLIRNILEMSEKTARDVMVPRTEVIALDIDEKPLEIVRVLAEHGHSRMPVYRGQIDNIVGILHARDLVPMLTHPELIVVQDIVRPAEFVPWSKPINELLREMQKNHIHMAIVVDEYGGFLGVLTLEDVLEVIVGDIQDEYDDDLPDVEALSDGSFLVRASMFIEDFKSNFSIELPEGDYETLGGFLNSLAGSIPESGDKFFFGGIQFTVQERTPRRVRRVRVQRTGSGVPPSGDARKKRESGTK